MIGISIHNETSNDISKTINSSNFEVGDVLCCSIDIDEGIMRFTSNDNKNSIQEIKFDKSITTTG
jgi:hypothetical protein